jgi:sialic acid synthase SpsE
MYLISEISNQWGGKMGVLEQMIWQSKLGGADAVKIQLWNSDWQPKRFNEKLGRDYMELNFTQAKTLKEYSDSIRIDFFASVFDEERLDWAVKLKLPFIKIANGVFTNKKDLADKAVATGRPIILSVNGEQIKAGRPYKNKNVQYLYTEPKYPTLHEDLTMPDFDNSFVIGYSDHVFGLSACAFALSRGAKILEKQFTVSKSWQRTGEAAHFGAMDFGELQQLQAMARDIDVLRHGNPLNFVA